MDGLEQKLDSILSDPESMAKIMELAQSLNLSPDSNSISTAAVDSEEKQTNHAPQFPFANLGPLLSEFSGQGFRKERAEQAVPTIPKIFQKVQKPADEAQGETNG